jgi:hypothetical protein
MTSSYGKRLKKSMDIARRVSKQLKCDELRRKLRMKAIGTDKA